MNEKESLLKPVVFENGRYNYYKKNSYKQNLLLKAMTITSDPVKMRQMADIKSVAEFYRELDKLQMRKEYHVALANEGVSLPFIVKGIKDVIISSESDATKLKALEIFLKSLGLNEYKETENTNKNSWEDLIVDVDKQETAGALPQLEIEDYEVTVPETPPDQLKRIEEEKEIGRSLYDTK